MSFYFSIGLVQLVFYSGPGAPLGHLPANAGTGAFLTKSHQPFSISVPGL